FAAGDITSFPVKQGGLASQQADTAAAAIAAAAGADVTAAPFRPVLRGLLLTGSQPRYLRHELTGGRGETSSATAQPLWWPPAKIAARYLAPFLAELVGAEPGAIPADGEAVDVEVELDVDAAQAFARLPAEPRRDAADDAGETTASVMTTDPLIVAPEDTLGEI